MYLNINGYNTIWVVYDEIELEDFANDFELREFDIEHEDYGDCVFDVYYSEELDEYMAVCRVVGW